MEINDYPIIFKNIRVKSISMLCSIDCPQRWKCWIDIKMVTSGITKDIEFNWWIRNITQADRNSIIVRRNWWDFKRG